MSKDSCCLNALKTQQKSKDSTNIKLSNVKINKFITHKALFSLKTLRQSTAVVNTKRRRETVARPREITEDMTSRPLLAISLPVRGCSIRLCSWRAELEGRFQLLLQIRHILDDDRIRYI